MRDMRPGKLNNCPVIKAKWIEGIWCDDCHEWIKYRCSYHGLTYYPLKTDVEFFVPYMFATYTCPHNGDARILKSAYEDL